jgi:hypothetical protein
MKHAGRGGGGKKKKKEKKKRNLVPHSQRAVLKKPHDTHVTSLAYVTTHTTTHDDAAKPVLNGTRE